jgi:GT2 family glycosyltransferase
VAPQLSIVIPTLGRSVVLARALDRLEAQDAPAESFEVIVVADANERAPDAIERLLDGAACAGRALRAARPGASAARNVGWSSASAPLVLFLDDDVLPERGLVGGHLERHRRHPEVEAGVLGRVRWADELRVTPFMRWLERGIQFDFDGIEGEDAGWGRFYTANVSVKRALLERVGGFEEEALPFGYEDLDLALRMRDHGFRLLYAREACAEHVHPMDLEFWKRRVARIAVAEQRFVALHPDVAPYFFELFSAAARDRPARGRGAALARLVPERTPVLGRRVWASADAVWRQALAPHFLAAWEAAQRGENVTSAAGEVPA